jgi:hypothetical protein
MGWYILTFIAGMFAGSFIGFVLLALLALAAKADKCGECLLFEQFMLRRREADACHGEETESGGEREGMENCRSHWRN